jgi:hypothetical protein
MLALELKFPGNCFVSLLTLCYAMQVCSWCIGTGASRILVLQVCIAILLCLVTVASSHWDRHSQDAIWMLGFAKNIVFLDTRRFRRAEKLVRLRDGCGRRRFAVECISNCARAVTEVSTWFFVSCCGLLVCFAFQCQQIAMEWLCQGSSLLRLRAW